MDHREGNTDWIKAFYDSAAGWWGESWYDGENLQSRLELVQQVSPGPDRRLLELAAGTGETAAYLCDHGYTVTAVELSRANAELIGKLCQGRPGLRLIEGDYLQVALAERFPVVCLFETFGIGSDAQQRRLLERINGEWLLEGGRVLLDVYHPCGPIRDAGTRLHLDRLEHVPGSLEMTEYSEYDGLRNRWIDTWEPVAEPAAARSQSFRCYTPADLQLLLAGSGLRLERLLYQGREIDFHGGQVQGGNPFDGPGRNYAYTVVLAHE